MRAICTLPDGPATLALTATDADPAPAVPAVVDGNTYAATNNGDGTWTLADDTIAPALAALQAADNLVADLQLRPRGNLRLTAPVELGQSVLGDALTWFTERHPEVDVVVDLTDRQVNLGGDHYKGGATADQQYRHRHSQNMDYVGRT